MRKLLIVPLLAIIGLLAASAATSAAPVSSLLVDRGLPTANLNDTAGANRSNVAWSFGTTDITGDSFSVGSAGQTFIITSIRTWSITHVDVHIGDIYTNDTLYLGTGGITPVETGNLTAGSNVDSNPDITHTAVTYSNSEGYGPANDPASRQLWQNDFSNLNYEVQGGQTYYFGVDGDVRSPCSASCNWYNHASNAALSGSTQQGSDGFYDDWVKTDLGSDPFACDSANQVDCGGWDKSSDINVEVFGYEVSPSITVEKSPDVRSIPAGHSVNYTVSVDNNTEVDVTLTSLVDNVFGNLNGQGTCSTGGTIAANSTYTCHFSGFISAPNFQNLHVDTVTATVTLGNEIDTAHGSTWVAVTRTHAPNNNHCGFLQFGTCRRRGPA